MEMVTAFEHESPTSPFVLQHELLWSILVPEETGSSESLIPRGSESLPTQTFVDFQEPQHDTLRRQ